MNIKCIYLFLLCTVSLTVQAQWVWYNPLNAEFPVVQNQGWIEEDSPNYHRLPQRAEGVVQPYVWRFAQHSTGLAIHYYSNASEIKVRYTVSRVLNMPHMPLTGSSGLDLYAKKSDGDWNFCAGKFVFKDTIEYTYRITETDRHDKRGLEYHLFLPLFNEVSWLEIGVAEESEFAFVPKSEELPVIVYGTSIAHGACASRPGMAWVNILQRHMDVPCLNLGFSGNGKLAKEVLEFICEKKARIYILDCLPNLMKKTEEEVFQLVCQAVDQIRENYETPILLIDHAGYSNSAVDSMRIVSICNKGSQRAFKFLRQKGVKKLYYLSKEELDFDKDSWVDAVHPSDLGMQIQAKAVEKKVRKILKYDHQNIK